MTKLKDKIQTGLDESRMLVLGAQILIGFAFSANFQPAFRDLPTRSQNLNVLALTLMLITICLLISSTTFHQLTEDGNDSVRLHRYTTHVMESVLILFSLDIGGRLLCIRGGHCGKHHHGCTCACHHGDRSFFLLRAAFVGAN